MKEEKIIRFEVNDARKSVIPMVIVAVILILATIYAATVSITRHYRRPAPIFGAATGSRA